MAVWGNVKSQGVAKDAKACAYAALGMRRELKKLNDQWKTEGRMTLGMGVGINQGDVLIGNIGSYEPHERLDPTVIGDAVNLASRLETHSDLRRRYPCWNKRGAIDTRRILSALRRPRAGERENGPGRCIHHR